MDPQIPTFPVALVIVVALAVLILIGPSIGLLPRVRDVTVAPPEEDPTILITPDGAAWRITCLLCGGGWAFSGDRNDGARRFGGTHICEGVLHEVQ